MTLRIKPLEWKMIHLGELQAQSGFGSMIIARIVNGEAYYRIGLERAVKVPGGINEVIDAAESTFAGRVLSWVHEPTAQIEPGEQP